MGLERILDVRALSTEPYIPADTSTEPRRGGVFGPRMLVVGALSLTAAWLAMQAGAILNGNSFLNQLPNGAGPKFGGNDTVMSGDGVPQKGETVGANGEGELAQDLERKQQLLKELVPVYQKAFAGPPWFEVSKCPTCPSGFSAQSIGESCGKCGSRLAEWAYPDNELYQSLLARTSGNDSVVYVERLPDGRPVLGAILRAMPEDTVVAKYQGRVDESWLRNVLPDRVIWLDEIFADLDARGSGNLKNLNEVIERSAEKIGSDTVAFRTINERLLGKVQSIYGNRATVLTVPDTAGAGKSYLVIIKL